MDWVSTNAALEENGARSLLQFVIPRQSPGLTIHETWDAMGMRATGSHELTLTDVLVPEEAVIVAREPGIYDIYAQEALKWFALSVAAVYTGIAMAARDFTLGLLGSGDQNGSHDRALRLRELGEIEVDLAASQTLIKNCAAKLDGNECEPRSDLLKASIETKYFTTNAALRVVHACLELVGGFGYLKRCPLERYYRDVRAGIIHPPNNRDALTMIGTMASGGWQADNNV
jgi:alkylation response protein AidB-like acyl-CoA dehydrogenase